VEAKKLWEDLMAEYGQSKNKLFEGVAKRSSRAA
jgi:hypothetical protein